MQLKPIAISVAAALGSSGPVWAEQAGEQLDEITVTAEADTSANPLSSAPKPNDIVVSQQKLRKSASTLGNALNGELGVHSSQFGGGASAPIIRGQEGVRLKVLQNGLDVVDMSQLSPDHAIAADTLLANQVEVVRGASTLLYATASPAGVVNVSDNRIPTAVPEKGYAVNLGLRYNTNSREKVENAAVTFGIGKHLVVRAEGLNRNADNYRVPTLQFNDATVQYLPNSQNKSNVGTFGLSLVGERGYFGAAYSERRDRYGLVGHNHKFDSCYGHIVDPLNQHFVNRYYLHVYPHLMDDSDVLEGAHFDCGSGHEDGATPSHSHPFGHDIVGGPFINMRLKRYEVRGELKKPLPYISKARINFAASDYHHDEKEGSSPPVNVFDNQAKNVRVEIVHEPIHGWRGVWGVQYQTQTSSAYVPRLTNPPKKLDYTATEVDSIIRDINGEDSTASAKPKQGKPTLGTKSDEALGVTPPGNVDSLIKDLFISSSSETPSTEKKATEKAPESNSSTELDDLLAGINQNKPSNPIDELIAGNAKDSALDLDDLLREINETPANDESDENGESSADNRDEADNDITSRQSAPSVGVDDLLNEINGSEKSDNAANGGTSGQKQGNFNDLLEELNNAAPNDTPTEENEEDEDSTANATPAPQTEGNNNSPSISVDQLLDGIQSTPKPQTQDSAANTVPTWQDRSTKDRSYALIENTAKQFSVFGMEQLVWRDFLFEVGVRSERQTFRIDYDRALLAQAKQVGISSQIQEPDLTPNKQRATSYSGAMYWNFKPEYLLSVILSHNERLPTPMELYYHGKHLATNSFEYGNKDLRKEVSNNVEIGLNYQTDRWSYTVNTYYNRFKNRIFKQTLNKEGNLSMNRYAQARADYYGVEGKIDYQLTPTVQIGVFGDYVRGVLKNLPPLRLKDSRKNTYEIPAGRNAPRVPPARLGAHLDVQFNDRFSATTRYTHAFAQNKVATLESATEGYNQLDLGLNYQHRLFGADYEWFLDANNLLNAKIYSHSSFLPFVPQMGRNFVMGVNVNF